MLITEIQVRNARLYGTEIALVERDPAACLPPNRWANSVSNCRTTNVPAG
jgi:hypothetical protein